MNQIKRWSVLYCSSVNEINQIITEQYQSKILIYDTYEHDKQIHPNHTLNWFCYLKITKSKAVFSYMDWQKKKQQIDFYLDREENPVNIDPAQAFAAMNRVYPVFDIMDYPKWLSNQLHLDESEKYVESARPYLFPNDQEVSPYNMTEQTVWVYDINNAYGSVLRNKVPDLANPLPTGKVAADEVGFVVIDDTIYSVYEGEDANVRFRLIESPWREWVDKWYARKANRLLSNSERRKAKQMINFAIGCCQRRNPFLRAYIVNECNRRIKSLIDSNTALCNTDSIHSTVRRPELDALLGTEIGRLKLEHEAAAIRYKGLNWQVVGGEIKYRGIPKGWFTKDFNILVDQAPNPNNIYYWDQENKIFVRNKDYGK